MGGLRAEEAGYVTGFHGGTLRVLDRPRVLLVNLGGGISARWRANKGRRPSRSRNATPKWCASWARTPAVAAFTGQLLKDPLIPSCRESPGRSAHRTRVHMTW